MKKITTFLALLLTCIIGATAADFVPKDGTKYLIKCKGDNNVVCTREGTNILQAQQSVSDASYFTFESKVVEKLPISTSTLLAMPQSTFTPQRLPQTTMTTMTEL